VELGVEDLTALSFGGREVGIGVLKAFDEPAEA
jgi:hypothetical protein